MLHKIRLLAAGLALLASSASAQQFRLNEVFVSHVGVDDREFIEVRGPANTSLNGFMILILEGDGTSSVGALDVAIDLSAGTTSASGLWTVGATTVTPAVDQVVSGPGSPPNTNLFENGAQTVYLIQTTNVPGVLANLGQDLRVGGMGTQTILATDPAITIVDLVGFDIPNTPGTIFDNAPVFVDGTFGAAGVARCSDAPFSWNLLDFDFVPSVGYFDVSPTTPNPTCGQNPGTAFCLGDGSAAACPCSNTSTVGSGEGCLNSLGVGGLLTAAGAASLAADSVLLTGSGMPNSSALYFQGTSQQGGGLGVAFGDGLRCAGGAIIRLGTKSNSAGGSSYPGVGDQPVSVRGLVGAPGTRTYQIWYRNAAAFCTPSTFNLSNGVEIAWGA
ncbi:MAG: hypothetical protein JNK02_12315 [Planctomycetes bacterium]|nr:hypothetical protein [Planctomycetota bacterium]